MHIPRKHFGQHFLCDQAIIHRIIAALAPKKDEQIVEIGPGQGALTLPLLKTLDHLDVIEIDRDLIPELKKRAEQGDGELHVHQADVLDFDFATLKQEEKPLRIVGNLPYNISTPLIFHLLTYAPLIKDMLFMLQKEVAERMAANANDDEYGRLSVMVQYHCKTELLFNVPPDAFFPPPKVDSSIIRLIPYQTYPYQARDYQLFESIVKHAFGQRRKTLRNSLKDIVNAEAWEKVQISSQLRPENLSVKDFVDISNAVS